MEEEKCGNCHYMRANPFNMNRPECHREPPTTDPGAGLGMFPTIQPDWWCGRHLNQSTAVAISEPEVAPAATQEPSPPKDKPLAEMSRYELVKVAGLYGINGNLKSSEMIEAIQAHRADEKSTAVGQVPREEA